MAGNFEGYEYTLKLKNLLTEKMEYARFKDSKKLQIIDFPEGNYAIIWINMIQKKFLLKDRKYVIHLPTNLMRVIRIRKNIVSYIGSFKGAESSKIEFDNNSKNIVNAKIEFSEDYQPDGDIQFVSIFDDPPW
jgi:hypothetical protein